MRLLESRVAVGSRGPPGPSTFPREAQAGSGGGVAIVGNCTQSVVRVSGPPVDCETPVRT